VLEPGPTEPDGPTPLEPLGPTPPLGPELPVGPTCEPVVPLLVEAGRVLEFAALEATLDEEIPPVDDEEYELPLESVELQLVPQGSASLAHAEIKKMPAAESREPKKAEERTVRNEMGVDITNSDWSMNIKDLRHPSKLAHRSRGRSPLIGFKRVAHCRI
jgi:hypothetical protein